MKRNVTILLIFCFQNIISQSIGFELRTSPDGTPREYIRGSVFKKSGFQFEIRHQPDAEGWRWTPSKTFKIGEAKIKLPLHYNSHKGFNKALTVEPRLIFPVGDFDLWVQKELWFNQNKNMAVSLDYKPKKIPMKFRLGYDASGYTRFVITYKLGKR